MFHKRTFLKQQFVNMKNVPGLSSISKRIEIFLKKRLKENPLNPQRGSECFFYKVFEDFIRSYDDVLIVEEHLEEV